MIPTPTHPHPETRSADLRNPSRSEALMTPVYKGKPLTAWLFSYLCVHDIFCSEKPPSVHRLEVEEAELVFEGFGGLITLTVDIETRADGYPIDFNPVHLSATVGAGPLEELRFDSGDIANPLIGLTHSLFNLVDLKRAAVLHALRDAFHSGKFR